MRCGYWGSTNLVTWHQFLHLKVPQCAILDSFRTSHGLECPRIPLSPRRGRDGDCSPPPARTRTGAINASGSYRRENGEGQRIS
jgi:hypothetical protein